MALVHISKGATKRSLKKIWAVLEDIAETQLLIILKLNDMSGASDKLAQTLLNSDKKLDGIVLNFNGIRSDYAELLKQIADLKTQVQNGNGATNEDMDKLQASAQAHADKLDNLFNTSKELDDSVTESPVVTSPVITSPVITSPVVTSPVVTSPVVESPVVSPVI